MFAVESIHILTADWYYCKKSSVIGFCVRFCNFDSALDVGS